MIPWQHLDKDEEHRIGLHWTITHKQYRMNNGAVMNAYVSGMNHHDGAAVIALTPENRVIIARQFRCGPEKIMDELPGGLIDAGETPEQAVLRELREEVGYTSDDIVYLGYVYSNAWSTTKHHYFLARNCYTLDSNNPEEFEEIEVDIVTIAALFDNAKSGAMTDTPGIMLAYDMLKELEEQ
jgi:ADP-ribose pyrophosphatase